MHEYDIDRFLNIRSAGYPEFSHDGNTLAFLTNITGVYQVWTVDEGCGWPQQRTFYDESVSFISWSPTSPVLAFGMDDGGDERRQIYLLDTDTGSITNATENPTAKHHWGGWSWSGDRFAFAANRESEGEFGIYVQGVEDEEAELICNSSGIYSVCGWSPDDTRLLVSETHSTTDKDLHVLNIESGELRRITPHEGNVRYRNPSWSPDGESVYAITDADSNTSYITRIALDTLNAEPVFRDDEWNVYGLAIDVRSGRCVIRRNVDGYTDVILAELDDGEFNRLSEPDFPDGVIAGASFHPSGDCFATSVSTDTLNKNVFVTDFATGTARQWTDVGTAGIPREEFHSSDLHQFESFDGLEVPGFLTFPDQSNGDPVPLIVDIHGGPASQRKPSFSGVKQYFVHHGYAYFEPNIRGSSGYGKEYRALDDVEKRMDSIHDIKACVEQVAQRPNIDSDRIAVMGASYGGFAVLASLTEYPDLWAAGVNIVGIANFVTFLENTGAWRRKHRESEYGSLEDNREFLERISPINNIENIDSPLFILHGENDPRVPVGEAEQISEAAAKQGVPVRKLIFDDEGHGFSKQENRIESYSAIVDFLNEHVE